ncbi:cell surface protein precursor, LPXTG-motif cell wall anchor, partial [Lactiplantibacillus plantarum IPLA88]
MSKALKIVMGITMLTGGIMAQKMTVHAAESNTRTGQAVRMNGTVSLASQVENNPAVKAAHYQVTQAVQALTMATTAVKTAMSDLQAAQTTLDAANKTLAKNQKIQTHMGVLKQAATDRHVKATKALDEQLATKKTSQTAVTTAQAAVTKSQAAVQVAQSNFDKDNSAANKVTLQTTQEKLKTVQETLTAAQANLDKTNEHVMMAEEELANAKIEVSGTSRDFQMA